MLSLKCLTWLWLPFHKLQSSSRSGRALSVSNLQLSMAFQQWEFTLCFLWWGMNLQSGLFRTILFFALHEPDQVINRWILHGADNILAGKWALHQTHSSRYWLHFWHSLGSVIVYSVPIDLKMLIRTKMTETRTLEWIIYWIRSRDFILKIYRGNSAFV